MLHLELSLDSFKGNRVAYIYFILFYFILFFFLLPLSSHIQYHFARLGSQKLPRLAKVALWRGIYPIGSHPMMRCSSLLCPCQGRGRWGKQFSRVH